MVENFSFSTTRTRRPFLIQYFNLSQGDSEGCERWCWNGEESEAVQKAESGIGLLAKRAGGLP